MHHLAGVFTSEEKKQSIDGMNMFCFAMIYPNKNRNYYCEDEKEFREWIGVFKKVTSFQDLNDTYEILETLGRGRFGLVKVCQNKETKRKAAIKIMSKKTMNPNDIQLIRTEIEILKICQHPNIIRLYDVFENQEYIYISKSQIIKIIVMELCLGGDLFTYLENRKFTIPETRAVELVHKLSTAVYYLHSYGITHRDLKPENILMTNTTDIADLRLVDFGLSKIIGPSERCDEPFGTLV